MKYLLTIDIGNTNTVCSLYDGKNYIVTKRINFNDDTIDEQAELENIFLFPYLP